MSFWYNLRSAVTNEISYCRSPYHTMKRKCSGALQQLKTSPKNSELKDVAPEDDLTPSLLLEYKQTSAVISEAVR